MARRRPTEATANPARGAVLVVVAVVIGLFLLRNGIDSSTTVSPDGSDAAASTDEGADEGATDDAGATTSSTLALRAPAEVPTIVLNDSGVTGAAGNYSAAIAAAGYALTNPQGETSTLPEDRPATSVLYAEGFQQEAAVLAAALGVQETEVQPLGTTLPGPIEGASVVVVLGTDLANVDPAIPPA
jgi:hypothetical protein